MKSKYKIVFLGNPSVGKTTLISQYVYKESDETYHPTIGIDFITTILNINGKPVKIQLWDTAGQERFNSIIPTYTRNSFIAVIVFDLSNPDSFKKIDKWINESINDPENKTKLIIVGNKMDLERKVLKEEIDTKIKKFNAFYVETCAMDYETIEELIIIINKLISEDVLKNPQIVDLESVNLNVKKKNKCCRIY